MSRAWLKPNQTAGSVKPEIDYDAIKEKYKQFRAARLRDDGTEQYTSDIENVKGGKYVDDPWAGEEEFMREPLNDTVDVIIIGGGFSALLTSSRLRDFGIEKIRIVERGADVGGTWYWNRFPGVACDVPSYDYLPLLDEMQYIPKRRYSQGPEIYSHCQNLAEKYDLYKLAIFRTTVTSTIFDPSTKLWSVGTDRGDSMKAHFVIVANGTLSKPKLPKYLIDGLEKFQGQSFHTSRWDYNVTGDNLEKLDGLRVGIVGTGATAVQAIPELAKAAGHLHVFQRTPSSVQVRGDFATDPNWARKLGPNYFNDRRQKMLDLMGKNSGFLNLGKEERERRATMTAEEKAKRAEQANIRAMQAIHRRIDNVVKDPVVAESLKPYYMIGCKRPTFHDEFLPTFNRPNVTLVDTKGKGINTINDKGIVFNGKTYELDVLIMATGFEVQKTGIWNEIRGMNNLELNDKYKDGVRTLLGIHSNGYPNMYIMGGYQASFSFNLVDILRKQGDHIARTINYAKELGEKHGQKFAAITCTYKAEDYWVNEVISHRGKSNYSKECTPGYYNFEGEEQRRQDGNYNGGVMKYYNEVDAIANNFEEHFEAV